MRELSKNRKTAKVLSLSLAMLQLSHINQTTDQELQDACLVILDQFNEQEMEGPKG
ncbi:hypothetical protein NSQ54_10575 [Alkalihalobacillus sp. FSL W8-0930]